MPKERKNRSIKRNPKTIKKPKATKKRWDYQTDVVCVGGGAAGCTAAIVAAHKGNKVILLEQAPTIGGTTAKSGGAVWIPNNYFLREKGIIDTKEDWLRYVVRLVYPKEYNATHKTLGIDKQAYRLLTAYYDNASVMVDKLCAMGVIKLRELKIEPVNRLVPDYFDHLPENKTPKGRALEPFLDKSQPHREIAQTLILQARGTFLVNMLETGLKKNHVTILTKHKAKHLIMEKGRVIGIEAKFGHKNMRIRAKKGVFFGTGGFAHNSELLSRYQPALYASCSSMGSQGDFISIAGEVGARMGPLNTAWRTQIPLEEALQNHETLRSVLFLPGDSMLMVNKTGRRVVNEKRDYNSRAKIHFVYDPVAGDFINQILIMIFDKRTLDSFAAIYPIPPANVEAPYLISGKNLKELEGQIAARLAKLKNKLGDGDYSLSKNFLANLTAEIERFNGFAQTGHDEDFSRGNYEFDREWHLLFSLPDKQNENPAPNPTMYPLAKSGPYYAVLLCPGALDTNCGPMIDAKARVLDNFGKPIPGLYGAGNCVSSPMRETYLGAGTTLGCAMTYAYIAGINIGS